MSKIVVVTNLKGGVGKTFLSTHLAWLFHQRGYSTILVDTDVDQADATKWVTGYKVKTPEPLKIYKGYNDLEVVWVEDKPVRGLEKWQYVIVDGRPDAAIGAKGIARADWVILPIDGKLSTENAEILIETLKTIEGNKKVLVVMNKALRNAKVSAKDFEYARSKNWYMWQEVIFHNAYVRIAEQEGKPIWNVKGQRGATVAQLRAIATLIEMER